MAEALPTRALSIQQPWAWLIVNGLKAVENRTWRSSFRGPILIHAGKAVDRDALTSLQRGFHPASGRKLDAGLAELRRHAQLMRMGGFVGVAEVVDCIDRSDDEWFVGPYAFVLRDARPIPFIPARGALGFFKVEGPGHG